jgi:signal peptidase I
MFFGRCPQWTLVRILILILASVVLFRFILVPVRLMGRSMEPTCHDGQIGIVNTWAYLGHQPRRGDLVGFRPDDNRQIIIKRIIGLPGERIAIHSGIVLINGQSMAEPYLTAQGAWEWPEETLGGKMFFVMGDNRIVSQQFRVDGSRIMGKLYGWHL